MMKKQIREFEEIAFQHMDFLYSHALQVTSNIEKTEHIIQETFACAFNKFRPEEIHDYQSWLVGIMEKVCIKEECLVVEA
ncbi:MAG: hypothetical protein GWP06_02640 [Actinobacteria bacterium]|nr:hypothetical protein [Actinomycetota bacterium]